MSSALVFANDIPNDMQSSVGSAESFAKKFAEHASHAEEVDYGTPDTPENESESESESSGESSEDQLVEVMFANDDTRTFKAIQWYIDYNREDDDAMSTFCVVRTSKRTRIVPLAIGHGYVEFENGEDDVQYDIDDDVMYLRAPERSVIFEFVYQAVTMFDRRFGN